MEREKHGSTKGLTMKIQKTNPKKCCRVCCRVDKITSNNK
jgi:hypothetical protein